MTKYKEKIFAERMYERLHFHFEMVCGDFGCKLIETNGEMDHVHLLVEPLPHTTPSKLVNSLKGVSSRFAYASPDGVLRQEFTELEKYYWKGGAYGRLAILLHHVVVHPWKWSKNTSKISKFVLISTP